MSIRPIANAYYFITLIGYFGAFLSKCDADEKPTAKSLIARAELARSEQEHFDLVSLVGQASRKEIASFLDTAADSQSKEVRLIAAGCLRHDSDNAVRIATFNALSHDREVDVQEIAWLSMPLSQIDTESKTASVKSESQIVRCATLFEEQTIEPLWDAMFDTSPIVRSVAVRRLGAIVEANIRLPEDARKILRAALIDAHATVRSDALVVASHLNDLALDNTHSVITDDRPFRTFETLLEDDPGSRSWRKEFMSRESTLVLAHFRIRFLTRTLAGTAVTKNLPLVPLDQKVLIGSLAAKIQIASRGTCPGLEHMLERGSQGSVLLEQLRSLAPVRVNELKSLP